jgi:hypothetical protein
MMIAAIVEIVNNGAGVTDVSLTWWGVLIVVLVIAVHGR